MNNDLVVIAGAALAFIAAVPQVVRTVRTRTTAGVSIPAHAVLLAAVVGWRLHAHRINSPMRIWAPLPAITVAFFGLGCYLAVAWQENRRQELATTGKVAAVAALVLTATYQSGNPELIGYAAGVFLAASYLPQAFKARHSDLAGVSASMWWIYAAIETLYATHGAMIASPAAVAAGLVVVPAAAYTAYRATIMNRPVGSCTDATHSRNHARELT